jgi:hypothetical protein
LRLDRAPAGPFFRLFWVTGICHVFRFFGWIWLDLVGFGWIWLDLAGFGWWVQKKVVLPGFT